MAQAEVARTPIGVASAQVETTRRFKYGPDAVLTPSNIMSFSRILFALPLAGAIIAEGRPSWGLAAAHIILWGSDRLDGWLASKQGPTETGKKLDRNSDKALAWAQFTALAVVGIAPIEAVGTMIGRDGVVEIDRFVNHKKGVEVKSSEKHGKIKTGLQAIAIGTAVTPVVAEVPEVVQGSIWIATAASVASGAIYLINSGRERRRIKKVRKQQAMEENVISLYPKVNA